jgi:hypothetical protein
LSDKEQADRNRQKTAVVKCDGPGRLDSFRGE